MDRKGNVLEDPLFGSFIVIAKVIEHGLLVAQVEVFLKMVMNLLILAFIVP
jgi:hypothetical protein